LRARDTTIPASVLTQHRRRVDHPVTRVARRLSAVSSVFPAVILRFCCRAAVDWPRAPLLVTMSLYDGLGRESELLVGNSFGCPV